MMERLSIEHDKMSTSDIDFDGISIVRIPSYKISIMIYSKSVAMVLRNRMLCVKGTVSEKYFEFHVLKKTTEQVRQNC